MPRLFQRNFDAGTLRARREQVARAIGDRALALVQGAGLHAGAELFRQTNELYYLTGVESPSSYLLINGAGGTSTLYLPHRDLRGERGDGKVLAAEDTEEVPALTGVDAVAPLENLTRDLSGLALRGVVDRLYTPYQPGESPAASRDRLVSAEVAESSDPWAGRPSRQGQLLSLLRSRFPRLALGDLSPILDSQRLVKDEREIELMRHAGWITAQGVTAAMRATRPGVMEYQLTAAARFVFQSYGARGDGYTAITAGGSNTWYTHYWRQSDPLRSGDLVLMDYAPDFAYYTSDIGRMWPVSGRFDRDQRVLYDYILEYHRTLLRLIKPGVTADEVMDGAADHMRPVLDRTPFQRPAHARAARALLDFRGHMSHPVGMSVHDVGRYRSAPLREGIVFSVDPMLWIEEDRQLARVEDTVVVTATGVENLTGSAVIDPDEIEALLAEDTSGAGFSLTLPPIA